MKLPVGWVVNQKLMRASGDLDRPWATTSMVYILPAASMISMLSDQGRIFLKHNATTFAAPGLAFEHFRDPTRNPWNLPFDNSQNTHKKNTQRPERLTGMSKLSK